MSDLWCDECREFVRPQVRTTMEPVEFWGQKEQWAVDKLVCPICGSDELDEKEPDDNA